MAAKLFVFFLFLGVLLSVTAFAQSEEGDGINLSADDDSGSFGNEDALGNAIEDEGEEDDDDSGFEPPNFDLPTGTPSPTEVVKVQTVPYEAPRTDDLMFADTFDEDVFGRWVRSATEKFSGEWEVAKRELEALEGDLGLRIMTTAKHHGIATSLGKGALVDNKGKGLVVSYEAKFEEGLNCGGAYLKLFNSKDLRDEEKKLSSFDNETPYVIMFGPDRCGSTDKVHVIIKQFNPISKEWVEHHLKSPPHVPFDKLTHVYTLVLTPDNRYSVLLDGRVEKQGSMTTDFEPSFTPPKEIDDPKSKKPADWVDEVKIPDPSAEKPEDWDENAPRKIIDKDAEMPEGWLEHETETIPDPHAEKPEDWDDEEDGEWVAPQVANPACEKAAGCGPWTAPEIPNPAYKGKWRAPLIDNPAYKGAWSPDKMPNPNYFESKNPHAVADIDSIGFELWTMDKGLLFDNIAISRSQEAVERFIDSTWKVRHGIEKQQDKKAEPDMPALKSMSASEKMVTGIMMLAATHPVAVAVGGATFVLVTVVGMLKLLKKTPRAQKPVAPPVTLEATGEEEQEKAREEPTEDDEDEREEAEEQSGEELKGSEQKATVRKRGAAKKD